MNDQSGTAQLRFLEETAIRLRQNGFTVEPIEDHHLPVRWEKGRLCRISGKGSVLYRQENMDSIRAQDALQVVIDTAKMTSEYMAILEYAPQLKATDLTGDYRILADFGDAVLASHPTERGVQFVTWEWDFDRKGVHHGHYFQDDYDAAMAVLLALLSAVVIPLSLSQQISDLSSLRQTSQEQTAQQDGEHSEHHADREELWKSQITPPTAGTLAALGGIAVLWLALGIYYWLLVAAWLYKSAVNEGMNKSLWMILGLFTNLLAVIAFLIVRDNPRRVKPQAAQ